jgi:cellulose synthase/poly-beta-1,6-N-acetylglucosamine synthase-like glycosyltransferase
MALAEWLLLRLEWLVFAYFIGVNSFYVVLLASAALELRQHRRLSRGEGRWRVLGSPVAPSISLIAPAYNESSTIITSLRALLGLNYPSLEIVVVNDGSTDDTLPILREHFGLVAVHPIYHKRIDTRPVRGLFYSSTYPNLVVVDKENGRKADALNAGINLANGDLVCAIDTDTLIESDALQRMVRPFLRRDDVLAVGGTIRIVNGSIIRGGRVDEARVPTSPLAALQVVEYLRAFLFGRLGWNRLGGNLIVSGAFGLFRRDAILAAGGYLHATIGEDMELILRLRRHAYEEGGPGRVDFVPDPVGWTEAPERLRSLAGQRDRWHRGLADVLWRHRRVLLNPRYGAMGLVSYPYFLFVELLAPVVEAVGLAGAVAGIAMGTINGDFALALFLAAYGLGAALTAATLAMEEVSFHRYERMRDRLALLGWTLVENLGYRQLTVYWRLRGLLGFLRGRTDWGAMERTGFAADPSTPSRGGSAR